MTPAIEYIKTGLIIADLNEPEYRCPCCGGYALARDDMADGSLYPIEWLAGIAAKHGAGVCNECADAHDKAELAEQD